MITVAVGQLSAVEAEAVVRPVASDLSPVNALSRDLAAAAGEELTERLERVGPMPVGGALVTPAGALSCDFIIHVVVMSDEEPQTAFTVQRALRNGLRRAADWEVTSLAVPPLGLGAGMLEADPAARTLVEILADHCAEGRPPLDITIVVGSEYEAGLFGRLVQELQGEA